MEGPALKWSSRNPAMKRAMMPEPAVAMFEKPKKRPACSVGMTAVMKAQSTEEKARRQGLAHQLGKPQHRRQRGQHRPRDPPVAAEDQDQDARRGNRAAGEDQRPAAD